MRNNFILLLLIFSTYSCSISTEEKTPIKKEDYKEGLRIFLSKNYNKINSNTIINNIQLNNTKQINNLYSKINHLPIWINDSLLLNKNGNDLLQLLSNSYNYGLDTGLYYHTPIHNLVTRIETIKNKSDRYESSAELEVLLTNSFFLIGKHLNYGIVEKDSSQLISVIPRKTYTINLTKLLLNSYKTDNVVNQLLKVQPQHQEYIKLQKEFEVYLKNASLSKESIPVKNFRLDSLKAYYQAKKALIHHHYLRENSTDSIYFIALKKFQQQHGLSPDGLIGKNTAKALSNQPYKDYLKIVLSLEKWRWKNDWDSTYIYVNIPSYEMKVYQNNNIVKRLNVVVGKLSTSTTELNGEMVYMIIYPYWNLPYSISSKELLPKLKKDSTYLTRNNFEVFTSKHKPLNPADINWKLVTQNNFNYKIRQKGGGTNSLGIIKFIFPNKHSIYFHDTPLKSFFKNDIRAYSHGCVRTQHPLELADVLLNFDENQNNIDTVHAYIESEEQIRITLNKKVPVHIHYFTSGTDTSNNLIFYKDVYGLDEKLMQLMQLDQSKSVIMPELVSK